jgi:chemotaxis protein methyltransferase WspC
MNVAPVERWLQEHAGLEASTLGAGVVARAARDRIEALRCRTVEDYLARLTTSEEERHILIERVVVPETWFFRDRPALDALARHVVETWGPAHPGAVFRVLSVPCSTGEEAYSLVLALALAGWPLTHLRVEAVDISRENLRRAAAGVYGRNSFRGDDLAFRESFFQRERDAWRVHDLVRAPVRFEQGNLLAPEFAAGRAPYDAIFCRNLLIYFDRATQRRAVRALERLLAPGAWIAVGPAEPVLLFDHGFEALRVPSAFLLRKAPKTPPRPPVAPAPRAASPERKATTPPLPPPSASARKTAAAPLAPPLAAREKPRAPADTLPGLRALADAGKLREARERGEALLAQGGATAELLCLLAVLAEAAGDETRAGELYRKALYLDPQHAEALAHLALLAEKHGDTRAAQQLRRRARRLADKEVA